jgi:hypothetical protein
MVVHDRPMVNSQEKSHGVFPEQLDKVIEIGVAVKDGNPGIASIEDVVNERIVQLVSSRQ